MAKITRHGKNIEFKKESNIMTFGELETIMKEANRSGRKISGYVTISQESFSKEYSKAARTYLFSSDNKRWLPNMCSASIWGDCLDGSDNGVKLSDYLFGKDCWKIEDCGIISFVLLSAYERNISVPEIFPTLDLAQQEMRKQFEEAVGQTPAEEYLENNEGELEKMSAWANDCGMEDGNADWNITMLFNNGTTVFSEKNFFNK